MPSDYSRTMFTESVQRTQERYGSRAMAARMEASERDDHTLGWREVDFIQERDGFYLATAGDDGWPYVQYRGGPPGFLKVLDAHTLAFADFGGNRQFISVGNIHADDRVSLFLMDYARQRRLKVLARARVHDAKEVPDLVAATTDPAYPGAVERVIVYDVIAWDWNCPQHIVPRFTAAEWHARE